MSLRQVIDEQENDPLGNPRCRISITLPDAEKTAIFISANSPKEAYSRPPEKVQNPNEILQLERYSYNAGAGESYQALVRPWVFKKNDVTFLGTGDHHELYYQLLSSGNSSKDDVLLSFDSHDDAKTNRFPKGDDIEEITLGNFVRVGVQETIRKVWRDYILIARPQTQTDHSVATFDQNNLALMPFTENTQQSLEYVIQLMSYAVTIAKQRKSKVILTIDLDFFGSFDTIAYNENEMKQVLDTIFSFVEKNKKYIRLVHLSESLGYTRDGNHQIQSIYSVLVQKLKELS
ncbi:hypothetical protein LRY58_00425 [Candidatus Woesebacteria bacterium]|nr:hypothetical protein [Candidatus Woesebacteria bacterium]